MKHTIPAPWVAQVPQVKRFHPVAPTSLDKKHDEYEAVDEEKLLEAIRVAKRRLDPADPLLRAALRAVRSNERKRIALGADRDALAIEALGEGSGRQRALRMKKAGPMPTAGEIQAQYNRQSGRCFYCHKRVRGKYHLDHVTPLASGSEVWDELNGIENLVISCPQCNLKKTSKLPGEFCGRLL